MAIRQTHTSPEEVGQELVQNMADPIRSALLLIMGTQMPTGYFMRMQLTNPQAIVGILYHQVFSLNLAEALQLSEDLIRIGKTAKHMITAEAIKRQQNN